MCGRRLRGGRGAWEEAEGQGRCVCVVGVVDVWKATQRGKRGVGRSGRPGQVCVVGVRLRRCVCVCDVL